MSKKTKTIYYCHQCKKVVHTIQEIYFVEQIRYRGFCSEQCIAKFFTPLIDFIKKEEELFRSEINLQENFNLTHHNLEQITDSTFKNPKEIWIGGEELSEELYYFIGQHELLNGNTKRLDPLEPPKGQVLYSVIITLLFENTPSFILGEIITADERLVDFYRKGKTLEEFQNLIIKKQLGAKINNDSNSIFSNQNDNLSKIENNQGESGEKKQDKSRTKKEIEIEERRELSEDEENDKNPANAGVQLPPELLTLLESKKAGHLTELLQERSKDDIPFERFQEYDIFLPETLEHPDEVYRYTDREKDVVLIYIRSFSEGNRSFFYIVICMQYVNDMESEEMLLIPIISFPSSDGDLYRKYKKGERIGGSPVN